MATPSKLDAHNARVRDALILPFKRKMASLTIRSDIWGDDLGRKSGAGDAHQETLSRARGAITELDHQVVLLSDLKLPGERKTARDSEAEVKNLLLAFAEMRLLLVGMAGTVAA